MTRYLQLKEATRLMRLYERLVTDWKLVGLSDADWELAAKLWADRHRSGAPIVDSDLLIAVSARQSGAILVTNNVRHFADLGLTIDNWAV